MKWTKKLPEGISGIYQIYCLSSGKRYVGHAWCLRTRWRTHKNLLRRNKHPNKHLQAAYNKYGKESFYFQVIEECTRLPNKQQTVEEMLIPKEQYWIDSLASYDPKLGYNLASVAGSNLGVKYSKEVVEANRQRAIKQWRDLEARKKLRNC